MCIPCSPPKAYTCIPDCGEVMYLQVIIRAPLTSCRGRIFRFTVAKHLPPAQRQTTLTPNTVIRHVARGHSSPSLVPITAYSTRSSHHASSESVLLENRPSITRPPSAGYIGLGLWRIQSPYFTDATLFSRNRQALCILYFLAVSPSHATLHTGSRLARTSRPADGSGCQ
jgi:hypothetical protein